MPRGRLSIALYLILVFASGIMVGVVSYRLYSTNTASANAPKATIGEFRRQYLEGIRTQVGVSDDQLHSIDLILQDTKRKLDELAVREKPLHDEIRDDHIQQIRNLLNDQQKAAYDNWRAARARKASQTK